MNPLPLPPPLPLLIPLAPTPMAVEIDAPKSQELTIGFLACGEGRNAKQVNARNVGIAEGTQSHGDSSAGGNGGIEDN